MTDPKQLAKENRERALLLAMANLMEEHGVEIAFDLEMDNIVFIEPGTDPDDGNPVAGWYAEAKGPQDLREQATKVGTDEW